MGREGPGGIHAVVLEIAIALCVSMAHFVKWVAEVMKKNTEISKYSTV